MPEPSFMFDENRWQKLIQQPDWYFEFVEFANKAKADLKRILINKPEVFLKKL
jgi:hypothetical protein